GAMAAKYPADWPMVQLQKSARRRLGRVRGSSNETRVEMLIRQLTVASLLSLAVISLPSSGILSGDRSISLEFLVVPLSPDGTGHLVNQFAEPAAAHVRFRG